MAHETSSCNTGRGLFLCSGLWLTDESAIPTESSSTCMDRFFICFFKYKCFEASPKTIAHNCAILYWFISVSGRFTVLCLKIGYLGFLMSFSQNRSIFVWWIHGSGSWHSQSIWWKPVSDLWLSHKRNQCFCPYQLKAYLWILKISAARILELYFSRIIQIWSSHLIKWISSSFNLMTVDSCRL